MKVLNKSDLNNIILSNFNASKYPGPYAFTYNESLIPLKSNRSIDKYKPTIKTTNTAKVLFKAFLTSLTALFLLIIECKEYTAKTGIQSSKITCIELTALNLL